MNNVINAFSVVYFVFMKVKTVRCGHNAITMLFPTRHNADTMLFPTNRDYLVSMHSSFKSRISEK